MKARVHESEHYAGPHRREYRLGLGLRNTMDGIHANFKRQTELCEDRTFPPVKGLHIKHDVAMHETSLLSKRFRMIY